MICRSLFTLTAAALLLSAIPARAHFVWVAVQSDSGGKPQACVWFSETAGEDDEQLLDKVAQTQVSARSIGSGKTILKLVKQTHGRTGAWVSQVPEGTGALSATCHYGVLDKRGQIFLLEYYGKYLDAAHPAFRAFARDEDLPLDIVPDSAATEKRTVTILFQGKPATGSEIVVHDPDGKVEKLKADEKGQVILASSKAGLYSIRARWEVDQAGSDKGKEYKKVVHYCTLALRAPQTKHDGATTDGASELMRRARLARAAWENFSGFEADIRIFAEGREQAGRIKVTATGEVELSGLQLKDDKALLTTLRSLVGHRLVSNSEDADVSFAEEPTGHPFGRLIRFNNDTSMGSHYRIKDDVIREVNRKTENGRFTISVFVVHRNEEGKYLPGVYSVSFWNKDGSLRSTTTTVETWKRIGPFDLPLTHDSVFSGASEQRNVRMEFSSHKLLPPTAK